MFDGRNGHKYLIYFHRCRRWHINYISFDKHIFIFSRSICSVLSILARKRCSWRNSYLFSAGKWPNREKERREGVLGFVGIYFGLRIEGSRMMLTIFVSGSVSVCICMCTLCRLMPVNAQLCVCFVQKNWIYAVRGDRKEKVLWTGTEKNQLEFVCCRGKGRAGVHFHYIFTSCRLRT